MHLFKSIVTKGEGENGCLFLNQLWGVYDVHFVLDIQIYLSPQYIDVGNVNVLLYVMSPPRQNSLPDFDSISNFKFK